MPFPVPDMPAIGQFRSTATHCDCGRWDLEGEALQLGPQNRVHTSWRCGRYVRIILQVGSPFAVVWASEPDQGKAS